VGMQYPLEIPPLVSEAKAMAAKLGFDLRSEGNSASEQHTTPSCCIDEVGHLLMTLAASVGNGNLGEIGTGAGIGASWIVCGLSPDSAFYTVELDSELADSVATLLQPYKNVTVINQDWRLDFRDHGPYDLVFADGGGIGSAEPENWSDIAGLLVPGGIMVIDDLTPEELWPLEWKGNPDSKRELAFRSGYFISHEIRSRPDVSTLVMVRKGSGGTRKDMKDEIASGV
jgi:predicted O-methyltransferase YrrM